MSGDEAAAVSGEQVAFANGIRDSKLALARWRAAPGVVLGPWLAGALAIAAGLLVAVWGVASLAPVDLSPFFLPGLDAPPTFGEYLIILGRNLLVLALHAAACVAGFIAGSAMREVAADKRGISRVIHEWAGPVAIGWVTIVTIFSLLTQAFGLGLRGATLAGQLGIEPATLMLTVLPHALPELTAVFLPLAAWLIAARQKRWHDLLAATGVTVSIALPMLLVAAALELTLWPELLELASTRA